jgi:response regulator RpfG family c-di-GMP phosphodiesterase
MATAQTINVLYVDDEANNLQSFTATFRRNFNVFTALSAKEAQLLLAKHDIHVLVTDQRMPETTGTELLAEAVKKYPEQTRILLTAYTDVQSIIDAINKGHIFRYLQKPWNEAELKTAIEEGYEIFDLRRKEKELIKQLVDKIAKR